MRGYTIESKRTRARSSGLRPRYIEGDKVRLRDGRIVVLTKVTVKDWGTEYVSNGFIIHNGLILRREK